MGVNPWAYVRFLTQKKPFASRLRIAVSRNLTWVPDYPSQYTKSNYFATAMASSNFTDKSFETPSLPMVTP